MQQNYQLIHCTCPELAVAETLAQHLINARLAACVNIIPGVVSIYRWQDKIETAQEHLLLIKSKEHLFTQVVSSIRQHHPYDLPEIIAVPISQGNPEYLQWIDTCLAPK